MVTKKWPCGHVEEVLIPDYTDRVESTFFGPDEEDESAGCPRCKRDAEVALAAETSAQALRIADKENGALRRRIRRMKASDRLRAASDARVDKLIDMVDRLISRGTS